MNVKARVSLGVHLVADRDRMRALHPDWTWVAVLTMCGIVVGQEVKAVAAELNVSRWACYQARKAVFLRLGIRSEAEFVIYAYRAGIVTVADSATQGNES